MSDPHAMQRLCGLMRKAVQDYEMISPGDKIMVGVSGGKDSVALTIGLAQLRRYLGFDYEVVAVTLDPQFDHQAVDYSPLAALFARCGVDTVRVTGGEPLVRPGVEQLVAGLKATPGIRKVTMTTNGVRLAEKLPALLAAGLDSVNISLDTLNEERFRAITRLGTLQDTLDGIEAAERAGFAKIKLNCVLLGGVNDDEITDFVALTREHPWQVRFIERMPMGCGKDFGTYLPSQAVLNRCPELEAVPHDGGAAGYRLPDAKGTVGLIAPMSHAFCAECSRIRITADGKLKPCLHSDAEITLRGLSGEELEQAIRRGILMKPERHHMDETGVTETHRGMFAIGG